MYIHSTHKRREKKIGSINFFLSNKLSKDDEYKIKIENFSELI